MSGNAMGASAKQIIHRVHSWGMVCRLQVRMFRILQQQTGCHGFESRRIPLGSVAQGIEHWSRKPETVLNSAIIKDVGVLGTQEVAPVATGHC